MTGQLADLSWFRRIQEIPCEAYLAMLAGWELTGDGSELCLGGSLLRGPVEQDHFFGTWRIEEIPCEAYQPSPSSAAHSRPRTR